MSMATGGQLLSAVEQDAQNYIDPNQNESTLADLLELASKDFSEISILLNLADRKELEEPLSAFNITLDDLSLILSVPAGKLIEALGEHEDIDRSILIEDLGIGINEIQEAYRKFIEQRWSYSWNIVLVGMIVIFSSLALTGFLVGQLSNIGRKKRPKKEQKTNTQDQKIEKKDSLIAAITTVHLHIKEAEESERLIIAWNREPVCVWKTSGKMMMPYQLRETLKTSRQS